jgi:hypothetical protein
VLDTPSSSHLHRRLHRLWCRLVDTHRRCPALQGGDLPLRWRCWPKLREATLVFKTRRDGGIAPGDREIAPTATSSLGFCAATKPHRRRQWEEWSRRVRLSPELRRQPHGVGDLAMKRAQVNVLSGCFFARESRDRACCSQSQRYAAQDTAH